jgi:hypothetical protein
MATRWDAVERVVIPPVAFGFMLAAWLLKLWYDTSSPRDEHFFAWFYWPTFGAAAFFAIRAVFIWLPPALQSAATSRRWDAVVARGACLVLAASSLFTFGRVLMFIRSANWYFETAWAYYSAPGIVLFALPPLTFIGSIALWPARTNPAPPRSLLTVLFAFVGTFVLYQLWVMLSRVACEACSGPAL